MVSGCRSNARPLVNCPICSKVLTDRRIPIRYPLLVVALLLSWLIEGLAPTVISGGQTAMPSGPVQNVASTLHRERDRLFESYALHRGMNTCAAWNATSLSEQHQFLAITDLLGNRSVVVDSRGERSMLTEIEEILGIIGQSPLGTCAGRRWSRIVVKGSASLMGYLRARSKELPDWRASEDPMGPHPPFDMSAETVIGPPRGQLHFWSDERLAQPIPRLEVFGSDCGNCIEIDIDYNSPWHHSAPDCVYRADGVWVSGLELQRLRWGGLGNGASPEWDYSLTCVSASAARTIETK